MNIKAKKIKVVKQSNLHHEFINSKRNTIILVSLEGEDTKDSFHIYYKDNANNKVDIGWIKISDKSEGSDSSDEIYNRYLEYVENNVIEKKYGADLKDLKKFMPVKPFYSAGKDLAYYQKLGHFLSDTNSFENFLSDLRDINKNVGLGIVDDDKVEKNFFNYGDAKDLYEISKFFKEYNIDAYGYQEENFDKLLEPLTEESSEISGYDKLHSLLSTNKYRNNIANKIVESLEAVELHKQKEILENAQVQKLLNYIVSDNDFGIEISELAGKLFNDSDVLNKIDELRQLLEVSVSNIDDIELGHYTSLRTLPLLIKDGESATVRLTNSSQMNDPREGRILSECIFEDKDRNYKTPSFYISSATTALDSLPMWKQYADDCQGAVMVYDKEFLKKLLKTTNNKLYKVCYIDTSAKDIKIEISADKTKKEDIEKTLGKLREIIKNSLSKAKDAEKVRNRIEKYLSGIGYLFKDVDYSYEEEYRIVQYLIPGSKGIVAEQSGDKPVPLLYFYLKREDDNILPVSYSEVKLGPKAIDIDYVEPYVRFASNGSTKVVKSKINFRD
ncbi:DUF2971 domain-containing protein [Ligilactobacillus animalis]|nr:DUF2971 domain-containing protein [Ligilactobacillus animalis]